MSLREIRSQPRRRRTAATPSAARSAAISSNPHSPIVGIGTSGARAAAATIVVGLIEALLPTVASPPPETLAVLLIDGGADAATFTVNVIVG